MTDAPETLAGLVAAQAERTPDAVAVVDGSARLTYGELVARARGVAAELAGLGVGPDVPVGVCAERSLLLPIGLLAALEAGGACLPLDPAYPGPRLAQMLAGAAPPVVLATAATAARVPPQAGRVVLLDGTHAPGSAPPASPARAAAADLAYLVYTSGSTGEPKGVMLTNGGLVHHAAAVAQLYGLGPGDRALQFASIGFDVSIEEIFPTLATGGTVVLRDDDVPVLGLAWLDWLTASGATVLNLPTAHWHEWVRDLRALGRRIPDGVRLVVVGGERALGSALAVWQEVGGDRVRWLNAYGPAEACVTATAFEGPRDRPWPAEVDPPIGRAVGGATLHVLDEGGQPVTDGDPGDLHIGGPGLARGYLGRPDLTAASFVDSPEGRLYRTGDLVRRLADGNLEFLGRRDEQVKIRGVRIELGEVESVLARHPAVAQAAVAAREDVPGDRRLVAYVVAAAAAAVPAAELRRFLGGHLPRHMLPAAFVHVDALPLTPSGKVDRAALPAPAGPAVTASAAPGALRTETEAAVAAVWSNVLGIEGIAAADDFFDLGGQSLQATQVVAALREACGVDLGVTALFDTPTVEALAARVDAARRGHAPAPPLLPRPRHDGDRLPLTFSQEHMWRVEAAADPPGLLNVTAMHRFDGPVDEGALQAALAHLVRRHEALRLSFGVDAGAPYQVLQPVADVALGITDLTARRADDGATALARLLAEQDSAALDLARAPLFRAHLYRLAGGRALLAATFDHLVCDGTSAYIFLGELVAAHEAIARGAEPALPPLPIQYPDYALWQRSWLTDEMLERQVDHWRRALAGMRLGPAVPFDRVPEVPTRRIVAREIAVGGALHAAVRRLARRCGATVFVVVAAALHAVFSRASGETDVLVSTTLSGRQRAEVARLVGCFHTVGRIRTDLSGDPPFTEVVERTRRAVLGLLDNHDVPFFRIRQAAIPPMPADGVAFLAAVPTELQYFPTARDAWTPGAGVVERPGPDRGPDELYFRGHMHTLVVTLLDDGTQLWGSFSYKTDWYDADTIERLASGLVDVLAAVVDDASLRLSQLPAEPCDGGVLRP